MTSPSDLRVEDHRLATGGGRYVADLCDLTAADLQFRLRPSDVWKAIQEASADG